jgi:7-keto-8-aminopelargonate synthetase-like enzyme
MALLYGPAGCLTAKNGRFRPGQSRFEAIAARVKEAGVLIAVASYSTLEADPPPPSLRWSVTTDHSDADIDAMVKAVGDAIKSIPT